MIHIKGGNFEMGDLFREGFLWEGPVHPVAVPDFLLCEFTVTQAQWTDLMRNNPSSHTGDGDLPVEQVSWDDIQSFIRKLNARTGRAYRLPSEAEWEYAARAGGSKVRFGNGRDIARPDEMNFNCSKEKKQPYSVIGEHRKKTLPAAVLRPTSWGCTI